MTQPSPPHIKCPFVVLTLTEAQILGDELADEIRDQLLTAAVNSQPQPQSAVPT